MGQREPGERALVITGCGVLSSIGVGFEEFGAALLAGRCGRTPVAGLFEEPMPRESACVMPGFKVSQFLGKKGTGSFDRITSLVVVACGLALEHSGLAVDDSNRDRIGIAIGTSTGSLKSTSDYSRETLVAERPYLVNPVLFPNTILNCPAAQAAIWHALKGVNATLSGGQVSSLMALRYAGMLIRQGYADALLVGAAEEFTPHVAWGYHHVDALRGTETLVGEGCAVFVLEDERTAAAAGRRALARVLACETGVSGAPEREDEAVHALAQCIERALRRSGAAADHVAAVAGCDGDEARPAEDEALRLALGALPQRRLHVKRQVGECYSAAGALQLTALLAEFTRGFDPGRLALVTSLSHDGNVGCALVQPCAA